MHRRRLLQLAMMTLGAAALPACAAQSDDPATRPGKVLVVGAGIAGLAAANTLRQQGYTVQVIEGNERIGGRIWTSRLWPDAPVDLGASWIHGTEGNPITTIAEQAGAQLITTSYDSGQVFGPDGAELDETQEAELESLGEEIAQVLSEAQDAEQDQSVQAAVQRGLNWQSLTPAQQRLVNFILTGTVEAEYSGSTVETSTFWFDDAEEFGGDDALFVDGYSVIIDALAEGLDIVTGAEVSEIDHRGPGVTIATDNGQYTGDTVIVTLPLGVLQQGAVVFEPPLSSAKQRAIAALGMGVLDKVYLRFTETFWDPGVDWIEYIPDDSDNWAEWVSLARPTGQPILLGFAAADFARRMEGLTDAEIVASAMGTVRTIYGSEIPEPDSFQITRWAADPFAFGSYSYNALGSDPAMRDALAEPEGQALVFAGEAASREYFGTVHGAYLSGVRAAEAVADGGG